MTKVYYVLKVLKEMPSILDEAQRNGIYGDSVCFYLAGHLSALVDYLLFNEDD